MIKLLSHKKEEDIIFLSLINPHFVARILSHAWKHFVKKSNRGNERIFGKNKFQLDAPYAIYWIWVCLHALDWEMFRAKILYAFTLLWNCCWREIPICF